MPAIRANDRGSELTRGTELHGLADTVFATELVDPSARIKDFLLAGVERMTCRAHFDEQILTKRGTR
jgi:hypothetical protein